MAKKKQKLELTWIGKDQRARLEPLILIEDPEKSYHAAHRVGEDDIFDNRLIFGDNLLALKSLEQEFTGKIKCIYIDPPFNTGQAMEHYDDGIEHSIWLSLIRERIQLLHHLLARDGTFFVHIDDNELGYLIVLMDEIFGRSNRLYVITFKQGSATGHKAINPGCVSTSNFVVIYAKNKGDWAPNRVYTPRDRDTRYSQFITNRHEGFEAWTTVPLMSAFAHSKGITVAEARRLAKDDKGSVDQFVLDNAEAVVRLARPSYDGVSAAAREVIDRSKEEPDRTFLLKRNGYSDMYFRGGERILFYADKLKLIDGRYVAGEPLTTIWDDILSNNLHKEGGVRFPKGKKPEGLVKRVFDIATNPGDWVLDSFAGSGTTGAVAHKMGRRWIMVELGEHCDSHILPRMSRVVDGTDDSGVTKGCEWEGGGGFRYYRLGPSLLKKDEWGNWVINTEFNAEMLAEAVCKLEGFAYAPSEDVYWQQGHSTETDFIYVTTQFMNRAMLTRLSDEVGEKRSLLVVCKAFRVRPDAFENLTLKKIPKAVLRKCEWGKDDYSMEIRDLPPAPPEEEEAPSSPPVTQAERRRKAPAAPTLFDMAEEGGAE